MCVMLSDPQSVKIIDSEVNYLHGKYPYELILEREFYLKGNALL